jgi:hypothetical protein
MKGVKFGPGATIRTDSPAVCEPGIMTAGAASGNSPVRPWRRPINVAKGTRPFT